SRRHMHTRIVLLAPVTALIVAFGAGCKSIDCGDGTAERDGVCVPANETVSAAACGPMTKLSGTVCVPSTPTVCDPDTSDDVVDINGVHVCVGRGVTGCSAKLSCVAPTDGKQTICGQLYDF